MGTPKKNPQKNFVRGSRIFTGEQNILIVTVCLRAETSIA